MKDWKLVNFCEFDKYAIKSYCAIHNVDESLNLGDITKVDETKLDDFNMMTWGFPCTDISCAGLQKGFIDGKGEKTRSGMYYEGIRILRYKKPALSIIENVKNLTGKRFKKEFEMILSDLDDAGYNSYYKVLNAKDFGVPQNRERVFIISIRKDLDNGRFVFPKGFDNGIRLKDVLEDEVDEKYYISDEKVEKFLSSLNFDDICSNQNTLKIDGNNFNQRCVVHTPNDVSRTLIGSGGSGGYHAGNEPKVLVKTSKENSMEKVKQLECTNDNAVKQIGNIVNTGNWNNPQRGRIYSQNGCSPALNCCGGGGLEPKILQVRDKQQIGIDKSLNDTRVIDNANCITAREDRGISNRKAEGTAVLETPDTSYCLDANYYKGTTPEQYIEKKRRQLVFENDVKKEDINIRKGDLCGYIIAIIDCVDILNTVKEGEGKNKKKYKKCREILYILWNEIKKEKIQWETRGLWRIQEEEVLQSGMRKQLYTITTESKCNMENSTHYSTKNQSKNTQKDKVRDLWNLWKTRCSSYQLELEGQFLGEFTGFMQELSQQNSQNQKCMFDMWRTSERVRLLQQALYQIQEIWVSIDDEEKNKMSELQSVNREPKDLRCLRIRKLTPKECFRLQGFDDSAYEAASKVVSNSQLYKQAGNSIVVDILYYIFVELYKAMPYLFNDLRLSSFFSGIGAFEVALDRLYESINNGNFPDPQVE